MKNQKGFTLIELMIVVAIVGVLASIALPVYGKYVLRSQISEGYIITGPARSNVSLICQIEQRLPADNIDADVPPPFEISGKYTDNVRVKDGLVIVEFGNNARSELHGQTITFTPSNCSRWQCTATEQIRPFLPKCSPGGSTTASATASNINDPSKGESFCKQGSTSKLAQEGSIRSNYLSKPKKGQSPKDVLLSQMNDMGSNTIQNGTNSTGSGWNQMYLKRAGDGGKCRVISTNKNYGYMAGGNDKWVGDFMTSTLTEIGVNKDDFNITITSEPGQKLKDQTVNINYKDSDGLWKDFSVVVGDTGMGSYLDWDTGTLKEGAYETMKHL